MPEYGPPGLFFSAFLAATLLPMSSEAVLGAALAAGMDGTVALSAASLGNVSAIVLNYVLGYVLYDKTHARLERSRMGRKTLAWGKRWGYGALLASWLPVIGDPLTLVAGLVRLNFWYFLLIAGSLRIVRYAAIVAVFSPG